MALHDNACWGELAGVGRAVDADECQMLRERSMAGQAGNIPSCAVHGDSVTEPVVDSGS